MLINKIRFRKLFNDTRILTMRTKKGLFIKYKFDQRSFITIINNIIVLFVFPSSLVRYIKGISIGEFTLIKFRIYKFNSRSPSLNSNDFIVRYVPCVSFST